MEIFGVKFVGINAENGTKLLLTLAFVAVVGLLRRALQVLARVLLRGRGNEQTRFWTRQAINVATTLLLLLGILFRMA